MLDQPRPSSGDLTEVVRHIEERLSGPVGVPAFAVADLPLASDYYHQDRMYLIGVYDETGGATLAFSDGTSWRRVQDRAVVS